MRKATTLLTIIASFVFYAFALATPASADPNSPGNNGTVKIHDANTAVEDMRNEPHVCRFYVDGFKFDDLSSGQWWIESWPPTGNRTEVRREAWTANGQGDWHSGVQTLPDGHYKLYAKQQNEATPGGNKQKVFWVECSVTPAATATPAPTGTPNGNATPTPAPTGTATPTPTPSSSATATPAPTVVGGTTTTNTGGTVTLTGGTTTTNGDTTTIVGGTTTIVGGTTTTTSNGTTTSITGGTTTIVGGTTTVNGANMTNVGGTPSTTGGTAVRGFESAPNAVGSVNPIVEVPGGSDQQSPNGVQAGVQNGAVAGVQSLPSTSTDRTPVLPLAAMGLTIMALGGLLLRRSGQQL